ncbi:MAG TPA: tetratricopeptide repeat protein [Gemmatimonadales bacterium]|nr:tetratricopeptide repeat protein [Gemmatimonadales bacterium]
MDISVDHLLTQARERFGLQDYYGAAHLLEEIVESGSAFADVHHLLGLCRSLLGQHERALEQFDRALVLNPRYIEAHIHRGIVLGELGRVADAEQAFRSAASHDGATETGFTRHIAARLANQHAALGEAYEEAGAVPEAIGQYARAVELGPDFHDVRYQLARLLLERGNPLAAREHLERILSANPAFLDARAALGLAHYLAGAPEEARAQWAAVLERQPGHSRASAYLSMVGKLT